MDRNKRNISQLRFLLLTAGCFLFYINLSSQIQPLSRNDKAQVEKSTTQYEAAISEGLTKEASRYLNDIANLYWEHNDYKKAIEYFEQSKELNAQLGNENGLAMIHNNLGMLYSDIAEYDNALTYFEKTLAARRSFNNTDGIVAALKNLTVVCNNLGMYERSIDMLKEALSIERESNDAERIASVYSMLSETYERAGDLENTKYYYDLFRTFYEFGNNEQIKKFQQQANEDEILRKTAELKAQRTQGRLNELNKALNDAESELEQFDQEQVRLTEALSKKEIQVQYLETLRDNDRLVSEQKLQEARTLRNMLILGALSLLLVSFFIYRNYTQEKKSKKILAAKNQEIEKQNLELAELNRIIAKHNYRMQTELNVGRDIQMSMLPNQFPKIDGVDLYASLVPALEVGGDMYDFFQIDDDHLIFGVGDVSDKGVPAALFMAVTKTLVKTNANYSTLPGQILTQVNNSLCEDNETSMFVTYFLCVLNTSTGEISYSNAGHNPPLLIRPDGDLKRLSELHGPVLGAVEGHEYGQSSEILQEQTQIVLYTDGVTEAMDEQNNQYSDERLHDIMHSNGSHNSKKSVESIINDVEKFRGVAEQSDDITILSLVYKGK